MYRRSGCGGARSYGSTVATTSSGCAGGGGNDTTEQRCGWTRGLRAPGTRLPQRGTRVAPQIFAEPRDQDVGVDRRNVPWSPKNILIDTVARSQQDLAYIRAESRQFWTLGVPHVVPTPPDGVLYSEHGEISRATDLPCFMSFHQE